MEFVCARITGSRPQTKIRAGGVFLMWAIDPRELRSTFLNPTSPAAHLTFERGRFPFLNPEL
jgi:hypothetical protein